MPKKTGKTVTVAVRLTEPCHRYLLEQVEKLGAARSVAELVEHIVMSWYHRRIWGGVDEEGRNTA